MDRRLVLYPWPAAESPAVPAGALVLTPNVRAAQHLEAGARRPMSLEALAREVLAAAGLGVAPAMLAHRALTEAARAVLPVAQAAGLAGALAPALRSLFRAGADLEALRHADSPRVRRLGELGLAYRARLRAGRLVDGAEALGEAARRAPAPRPVFVTGYPRLGADEAAFLEAIAGPGSLVRLPLGTLDAFTENVATAAAFQARGWAVERPGELAVMPLAPIGARARAHAFASREDEVRHVLARVKALLDAGTPPSNVALVVRDDADYGPLALAIAWEYQVPLRALYAVPLAETRLGVWLDQVLCAAEEGLRFEATFRALDHVLVDALEGETWAAARRTRPAGEAAWRALGVPVDHLCWPAQDTRGGWIARLRGLLGDLGVRQAAARWPRELLALRRLLDELAAPAEEPLGREAFADLVREALRLLTVPAQPGRGGVELHTPFALYGAAYPHVFVLGLAEGVLPTPVSNDPALDFHERRGLLPLGVVLEDAVGAARRERLSFLARLEAAPGALTLSYARQVGGRELGPSAYFRELGTPLSEAPAVGEARAERVRRAWAAAEGGEADALTPRIRRALAIERRREGALAPDEFDGVVGVAVPLAGRTFSATQLTAIGQCPFKWFSAYALSLRAPAEPGEELQPSVRGQLYHKALELAAEDLLGVPDPRQAMLDGLEAAIAAAEAALEIPALPAWPERRAEHLATLRKAILAPDFLAPDATMHLLEAPFDASWAGLRVKGFVDRVDRHADGAVTLVDYKTSATPPRGIQDAHGKPSIDVQLPLYMAVAAPSLAPGAPVRRAYYYSLTRARTLRQAEAADPALDALAETLKRRLREGDFPVAPDVDGAACAYCDHDLVCRKGPRLARKAGAGPQAAQPQAAGASA